MTISVLDVTDLPSKLFDAWMRLRGVCEPFDGDVMGPAPYDEFELDPGDTEGLNALVAKDIATVEAALMDGERLRRKRARKA